MSIKNDVLSLLLENRGNYISGNSIAKTLSVSRNSVWKSIKSLEKDGYKITASTNKGYSLSVENDILSTQGILNHLENKDFYDIEYFPEVTSTNTLIKDYANCNSLEGKVFVSAKQTAGRGRLGRSFYSPEDTGVYFSILLRPVLSTDKIIFLTSMIANAVVSAISDTMNLDAKIKWVNDIFINDKKVCGILSEASFTVENFSLDYVTLGIGINIYSPKNGFPDELSNTAGYILDEKIDDIRNTLVAKILDNFLDNYKIFDTEKIAKEYKNNSFILGKDILVLQNDTALKATVLDIDENCALVVKYEDNSVKTLFSGEISTKII